MGGNSLCMKVYVDARKLHSNDTQLVTPCIEVFDGIPFRLMLFPSCSGKLNETHATQRNTSFRKARGHGSVVLKCTAGEALAPKFRFNISVGSGSRVQAPRGPVEHDFSLSAVCGLPKGEQQWDFSSAVEPETSSFVVSVQIFPLCA